MEGRAVRFLRGALQLAEQSAAAPGTAPVFIFLCAFFHLYAFFRFFPNIFMRLSTIYYASFDYLCFFWLYASFVLRQARRLLLYAFFLF